VINAGFGIKTPPGIYGATVVREALLHCSWSLRNSEVFIDAGARGSETREFRENNGHVIERV